MSQHTEGPWFHEGRFVYALQDATWRGSPAKENRFAATVSGKTPEEEMVANARLMAAAPDLLAALKAIEWIQIGNLMECPSCRFVMPIGTNGPGRAKAEHFSDCTLAAAILKATGEVRP